MALLPIPLRPPPLLPLHPHPFPSRRPAPHAHLRLNADAAAQPSGGAHHPPPATPLPSRCPRRLVSPDPPRRDTLKTQDGRWCGGALKSFRLSARGPRTADAERRHRWCRWPAGPAHPPTSASGVRHPPARRRRRRSLRGYHTASFDAADAVDGGGGATAAAASTGGGHATTPTAPSCRRHGIGRPSATGTGRDGMKDRRPPSAGHDALPTKDAARQCGGPSDAASGPSHGIPTSLCIL